MKILDCISLPKYNIVIYSRNIQKVFTKTNASQKTGKLYDIYVGSTIIKYISCEYRDTKIITFFEF